MLLVTEPWTESNTPQARLGLQLDFEVQSLTSADSPLSLGPTRPANLAGAEREEPAASGCLDLLNPFRDHARLGPLIGQGSFDFGGDSLAGPAEFLLPQGCQAVVALRSTTGPSSQGFATNLEIAGQTDGRPFKIECDHAYVRRSGLHDADGEWGSSRAGCRPAGCAHCSSMGC